MKWEETKLPYTKDKEEHYDSVVPELILFFGSKKLHILEMDMRNGE